MSDYKLTVSLKGRSKIGL